MQTPMPPVEIWKLTPQEVEALKVGGMYWCTSDDPCDAEPVYRIMEESDTIGTFYVRWEDTRALWEIKTDEGVSLEDLMHELGRLELLALGRVTHGDPPPAGRTP